VQSTIPVSEQITKLTGITQSAVDKFGYTSESALQIVLDMANEADAFIGHNVRSFDKYILESWAEREGAEIPNKLWVDTLTDLPGVEPKKLSYLAADHGFLNLFPHSALADTQTVLKILEHYDIDAVIERAKSPVVIMQAHQDRNDNNKAKEAKFRWNPTRKIWWKPVKEVDKEVFVESLSFDVSIRADLTQEDLEN
jgi:DNA polymerase-3 subunit epsilon